MFYIFFGINFSFWSCNTWISNFHFSWIIFFLFFIFFFGMFFFILSSSLIPIKLANPESRIYDPKFFFCPFEENTWEAHLNTSIFDLQLIKSPKCFGISFVIISPVYSSASTPGTGFIFHINIYKLVEILSYEFTSCFT